MKTKLFFGLLIALLFVNDVAAQSSFVTTARMEYEKAMSLLGSGKIDEISPENLVKIKKSLQIAVDKIEPAALNAKTSLKSKTWRYRGDIYQIIARLGSTGDIISVAPNAVALGAESYMKAMELDSKGSYERENQGGLRIMENLAVNNGINNYNAAKFDEAYKSFHLANQLSEKMGVVDSVAVFNAGLSADRAEMYQEAADYYQQCIDMNFKEEGLYKSLYDSYLKMDRKDEAFEILQNGIKKNPNDQGLIIDLINVYLENDELEKAMTYLEASVQNDPNNAVLHYSAGSVYDNLDRKDEARASYQKAIELDPKYFEASYNLGASYYNEAAAIIKEVNQLPLNQTKKATEGTEKAKSLFTKAMPHLESAYALNPEDASTKQSLKEVYVRLNMTEKYKTVK